MSHLLMMRLLRSIRMEVIEKSYERPLPAVSKFSGAAVREAGCYVQCIIFLVFYVETA
jgi:hypothetical protein